MKKQFRGYLFFSILVAIICLQLNPRTGQAQTESGNLTEQQRLWHRATAFLGDGNKKEAAPLFLLFYESYPDSKQAEDALWNAARLQKHLAFDSEKADWDKINRLYRDFTVNFPESERLPLAYLEVGKAFMKMEYFREAVPYFGLIVRRFPEHDVAEEAGILKARALYKTGRVDDAVAIYKEIGGRADENYERLADGYLYYSRSRYHDALGSFLKILKKDPSFYLKEPDLLRIMGDCFLETGQAEQGRKSLEHYLNLGTGSHQAEILFQVGESYLDEEKKGLAANFYEKALAASEQGDRIHSLSGFRLARFEEEEKKTDMPEARISEEDFVKTREAVIEHGSSGEIVQEARLELIEHYWDSQEIDKVLDLGRIYLNYGDEGPGGKKVEDMVCRILDDRLGAMLNGEKYEEAYRLYKDEYSYIRSCDRAAVRIKAGKALERLSLYDKASVVYWRAMGLEMSPEEKNDLYIHRVKTYLAGKAYKSADILLSHLRRIYKSESLIGDIYFLSGKLSEVKGNEESAHEFYEKAASESFYYNDNKAEFAEKYLRILLSQEKTDLFSKELARFEKDGWLGVVRLQYWYVGLGDYYRKRDDMRKAGEAYMAALAEGMPGDNEMAQQANLYHGDVQFALGNVEQAVLFHKKALRGPEKLLAKMALRRLEEDKMAPGLSEME